MEIKSLATPVSMGIYPLLWRNMDFYETGSQITIPSFIFLILLVLRSKIRSSGEERIFLLLKFLYFMAFLTYPYCQVHHLVHHLYTTLRASTTNSISFNFSSSVV